MSVQAKRLAEVKARQEGVKRPGSNVDTDADAMAQEVQGMWDFRRGTYPTAPDGAAPGHRRERVEPAVGVAATGVRHCSEMSMQVTIL